MVIPYCEGNKMRILSKNEIKKLADETVEQTKQLLEGYETFFHRFLHLT